MYVLTNHHVERFRRMYEETSEAVLQHLLVRGEKYTCITTPCPAGDSLLLDSARSCGGARGH